MSFVCRYCADTVEAHERGRACPFQPRVPCQPYPPPINIDRQYPGGRLAGLKLRKRGRR